MSNGRRFRRRVFRTQRYTKKTFKDLHKRGFLRTPRPDGWRKQVGQR